MWHVKNNGQGYIFCKRVFINLSFCKSVRGRWRWAKIAPFQINVNYFLCWQNIMFWKICIPQHYTCWILSDFFPKFGLFQYANLPSYKRVRWGRPAGPFLIQSRPTHFKFYPFFGKMRRRRTKTDSWNLRMIY